MRKALIAAPIIGLAVGAGALVWASQRADAHGGGMYEQIELFSAVLAEVEDRYVEEIDESEAIRAAINGMLLSLDPHSTYLAPEELLNLHEQTRGEYGGLGIEVTSEDGAVKVISPIDNTPASRAGIQSGDYLTAINGESIIGLSLNDAVRRMRGDVGSDVTVRVHRDQAEPFDVTLRREVITVRAVTSRVEDGVAILRVSTFNEQTTAALQQAIRDVQRETGGRPAGIVLDLRNNPGGLLDTAIEVSDMFLERGEIVHTRGRRASDMQLFTARPGELMAGVPMVVLINGGSASASEIVAGALKDHNRALIVGTTSFGKGSVQTVLPLENGRDGALKLTTARYYTPSGRSIQGAGIEPDREVAQVRVDMDRVERATRFTEADLPNALSNEDGARRRGPHVPDDQPPEGWDADQDYQLIRAMQFLRTGLVAQALADRDG
jgi:carboxyl-terminal processing protease